jgi:PAS domain S-box-containing protein
MKTKLTFSTVALMLIVFVLVFLLVTLINIYATRQNISQTEKLIHSFIVAKGTMIVTNNSIALKNMANDNAKSDIEQLVLSTVLNGKDIEYGIYLDDNRRAWVIALTGNPEPAAISSEPLSDSMSLWASKLTSASMKDYHFKNKNVLEFASPIYVNYEKVGTIRYGLSLEGMYTSMRNAEIQSHKNLYSTLWLLLIIVFVTMTGSTIVANIQARKITNPVSILADAAQEIAKGNYDGEIKIISDDEIGVLAKSFETMRRTVKNYTGHLQDLIKEKIRNEERYRRLLENGNDAIYIYELDITGMPGCFTDVNKRACSLLGYSKEEMLKMTPADIYDKDSLNQIKDTIGIMISKIRQIYEIENIAKDGKRIPVEVNEHCFSIDEKPMVMAIARDITERKAAESALRESEYKYRSLVETAQELVWKCNKDGCFTYLNPAWEKTHGYQLSEMLGRSFKEFQPADIYERDMEVFKTTLTNGGTVKNYETTHIAKDGSELTLLFNYVSLYDMSGVLIGMQGTAVDITERKRAQEEQKKLELQLNQSQRLESLGLLAGGIAHDFNNLLGGIFGYLEIATHSVNDNDVQTYLGTALATIDRAKGLTQQLLTFAKGGMPIKKLEVLTPFLQKTAQFALSGSNLSCEFKIDENLWMCNFDKNQIGQVVDNIVINAMQAMPMGGVIKFSAQNIQIVSKADTTLIPGPYVKISIQDQGIGIHQEYLQKIFDPFFTTKSKGHGLGLATSYSIVKRHGGNIDVESEIGKGSIFHIYLPASPKLHLHQSTEIMQKHKGSGTIIIMDDEDVVRLATEIMLKRFGYNVISTKDGAEAIEVFKSRRQMTSDITGLFFDLTIPGGMGGKDAILEIRTIDSSVPVFVVSGYADNPVMANPTAYGFTASISKPFLITELAVILNKYLIKEKS